MGTHQALGPTQRVAPTVDVWVGLVARLTAPSPDAVLAPEELGRAAAFRDAGARARFVAGRVLLRLALGRRLGLDPRALAVEVLPGGRPVLPPRDLDFSLSHAGALVLLAVLAGAGGVGVDVERIRPLPAAERIARTHFPPAERAAFLELPAEERGVGFFRAWTRLEARFKLDPTVDDSIVQEWVPAPGYRAAVATREPVLVRHMPPPGGD